MQTYELRSLFIAESGVWISGKRVSAFLVLGVSNTVLFAGSAVAVALLDVAHDGRWGERFRGSLMPGKNT